MAKTEHQIILSREQFARCFALADGFASAKNRRVTLYSRGSELRLYAGNEWAMVSTVAAETVVIPPTQLPVEQVSRILKESTADKLDIKLQQSSIVIECDRSRFVLPTADPGAFSEPLEDWEHHYRISSSALRNIIESTAFACDESEGRYAQSGVLLEISAGRLTAVGTDGRRLALHRCDVEPVGNPLFPDPCIVSRRALKMLQQVLRDDSGDCLIQATSSNLVVNTSSATVWLHRLEGRFPQWQKIVVAPLLTVDTLAGQLYSSLRQASVVCQSNSPGIDFVFRSGQLLIAGTTESGSTRCTLPVSYDAEELVVRLNEKYLAEFLRILDPGAQVTIGLRSGLEPVVFTTAGGHYYMVMPLAAVK